jgi:2-keto-3-deoxy-L-rhamnonate aldolase RhmA
LSVSGGSDPKLGFVLICHGDLSVFLGHPLETDHEDVQSAIETIRTARLDNGVPAGGSVSDADAASELLSEGSSPVRICDEIDSPRKPLRRRMSELDPFE